MNYGLLIIEFFESLGKFLNEYAMLILVFITFFYAWSTHKMAKLMAKQTTSDIKVSNIILGSPFIEDWFLERLKDQSVQINEDSFFEFKLLFDAYNKSSGSGSIEKPILILRFTNDSFEYKALPTTKESYDTDIRKEGVMTTYRTVVNDFGGAIFFRGGEFQKIELEYMLNNLSKELLTHVKENLNSIEYFIKFSDNLDKKYLFKIQKIQPAEKTYRR